MTDERLRQIAASVIDNHYPGCEYETHEEVRTLAEAYLALRAKEAALEYKATILAFNVVAASEVLDELAAPDPDKPLARRIRDELADFQMVVRHASHVFDHVTHGQISKPNTLPTVVCAVADDVTTELCEEAVKEAREEWDAEHIPRLPELDHALLRRLRAMTREQLLDWLAELYENVDLKL